MNIKISNFIDGAGYCDDFRKICDFLIRINYNEIFKVYENSPTEVLSVRLFFF